MKIFKVVVLISLLPLSVPDIWAESLWKAGENPQSLFIDQRASKVGDLLTILIIETTSASQRATTSRNRQSNIKGEVKDWSQIEFYHGPRTKHAQLKPIWNIDTANKFGGGGVYSGDYRIRGQVTAQVIEVLPNKNLVIEGISEVWINRERNTIAISGIARPEDLSGGNTILSTQLAEVKVKIVSKGPLHAKTRRGFFEILLDWLWPF